MGSTGSTRGQLLGGLAAGFGFALLMGFMAVLERSRPGAGLWDDRPRTAAALAVALVMGMGAGLLMVAAPGWLERRGVRPERIVLLRSFAPLGLIVGMLVVIAVARGSVLGALITFGWWWLPMYAGAGIASAGHLRREGDARHCPKCDYEFGFPDESAAPRVCPECGTAWIGRLVRGTRKGSPGMMAVGYAVAGSTFVFMFSGMTGLNLAPHLPTGALIAWTGAGEHITKPMAELAGRTLTAEQTVDLARRLLDRRAAARYSISADGIKWLDAQIAAGALPAELRERFFAEMFTGDLHAPSSVRVGEPFTVGLRGSDAADGFTHKCFVCIAGFGVGDGPATAGRSADAHYPNLINMAKPTAYTKAATATLVANRPGETVVRGEIWIVVAGRSPAPVTWGSDGTPSFAAPVDWVKKVVLERRVRVTE